LDENGNPYYRVLAESEFEFNSVEGRVRLDPRGPTSDNPNGWTIIGPNQGSGAAPVFVIAGTAAAADGPVPIGDIAAIFMAGYGIYLVATAPAPLQLPTIFNEDKADDAGKPNEGNKNTPPPTPGPKADEPPADDQISGSLKRSPSYHSELGSKTKSELEKLAKQGGEVGKRAKQMLKLIKEGTRLRGKGNKK